MTKVMVLVRLRSVVMLVKGLLFFIFIVLQPREMLSMIVLIVDHFVYNMLMMGRFGKMCPRMAFLM